MTVCRFLTKINDIDGSWITSVPGLLLHCAEASAIVTAGAGFIGLMLIDLHGLRNIVRSSAAAIAAICSGVVPQQPPIIRAPRSANLRADSAKYSGVPLKHIFTVHIIRNTRIRKYGQRKFYFSVDRINCTHNAIRAASAIEAHNICTLLPKGFKSSSSG